MDPVDVLNDLIGREADTSLNKHERTVCLLNAFESECVNGGWDQYLWNSSGDYAEDLQPYLAEFGYTSTLEAFAIIRSAMGGQIPKDRRERIAKLDRTREEIYDQVHNLIGKDLTLVFPDICKYIASNNVEFTGSRSGRSSR